MANTPTTTQPISLSEFMTRFAEEGPFEIIDGEIIPMTPQATRRGRIAFRLARLLADYVDAQQLGEVFIEVPFVLTDDADWVRGSRVPDVMFIAADRLKQLAEQDADWEQKPLLIAPDLAVELVSPTDRYSAVNAKVNSYLQDGVQLIWVIDPDTESVSVYRQADNSITQLNAEGVLSGEGIVPDFSLTVADLFQKTI